MPSERAYTLAQHLFRLPKKRSILEPVSDAQLAIAARVGSAILSDLITRCQKAWREAGPGVMMIRLVEDDARWLTPEELEANLRIAQEQDDRGMADLLRAALSRLDGLDPAKLVLLILADHRGLRLLPITTDNPDTRLKDLLEQWPSA